MTKECLGWNAVNLFLSLMIVGGVVLRDETLKLPPMTHNDLFVLDTHGDPSLLYAQPEQEPEDTQDSFIPLQPPRSARKARKKGKKPKSNAERVQLVDDEDAVLRDYMENADLDFLDMQHAVTAIAPAMTFDESSASEVDSDFDQHGETGLHEILMQEEDDLMESSDLDDSSIMSFTDEDDVLEEDSDSDEISYAIGKSLKQTHLFDFDEEEDLIREEFSGGPSTWNAKTFEAVRKHEKKRGDEAYFQKLLNGDHAGVVDFDSDDSFEETNKGLSQRRRDAKRNKQLKKQQKKQAESNMRQNEAELRRSLKKQLENQTNEISPSLKKYFQKVNKDFHNFARDPQKPPITVLAPMPKSIRQIVIQMSKHYRLSVKTSGKGTNKVAVVARTKHTHVPDSWTKVASTVMDSDFKNRLPSSIGKREVAMATKKAKKGKKGKSGNGGGGSSSKEGRRGPSESAHAVLSRPKVGDVVGGKAAPLGQSNMGHKMMLMMGWKPGEALGSGEGLVNPVEAVIRAKRGGLGA